MQTNATQRAMELRKKGKSYGEIAKAMNQEGYTTQKGGKFSDRNIWYYVRGEQKTGRDRKRATKEDKTAHSNVAFISALTDTIYRTQGLRPETKQKIVALILDDLIDVNH